MPDAWSRRAGLLPGLDFYWLLLTCAAPCVRGSEILPEGHPA
jgi:hypothetical protein